MSQTENQTTTPKSIRQKQILDIAAEKPEASVEAIADEVQSATPVVVEKVLAEYGDPVTGQSDTATSDGTHFPPLEELSEKQWETLEAIQDHPCLSQRDLADILNISGATVSNRVNSIDGFDWDDRQAFAEVMLEGRTVADEAATESGDGKDNSEDSVHDLVSRIERLERRLDDQPTDPLACPELTHKVIHACISADHITEDEELRIIESVVNRC